MSVSRADRVYVDALVSRIGQQGMIWEITLIGTRALPDHVIKQIAGGKVRVSFERKEGGAVVNVSGGNRLALDKPSRGRITKRVTRSKDRKQT